jgi:hypothetical protein
MLQHGPIAPPLGTAADLGAANQYVAWRSSLETEERRRGSLEFVSRPTQAGRDTEVFQGLNQTTMNDPIKFVAVGSQPMRSRQDDTVGQFGIVQDCPTSG